ncbi:GPI ethanolamine phosphate transferase 2 [Condylostylus longicornis]|uniref:GPI ethanolamine phosphate transferase 2 n=1 Tax=Condylostylus longicornis TaxID=2530218 RepID=UPI00244DB070|nr:GPI ethanolamine phosphate transferase 2 [Condylostylus longicornis]
MMKIYTFLVYKTLFILGVFLFAYGFFPVTNYDPRLSNFEQNILDYAVPVKPNSMTRNSKLILMIIDALRFDFVDNRMKYTNEQIMQEKICKIKVKADAPTVTMPRIKSILTGRTSSFADVIFNLGDQDLNTDSLMRQFIAAKKKVVLYGDNTWGKLFPRQVFHRAQLNHDSFFVNDFYEGDKNITKNINSELEKNDWDIIILHYLGLDHIGHVEGTASLKIPFKLKEMDDIIYKISQKIDERKNENIMLLVTSDHGMRNEGGHGGGSREETEIPLLFSGHDCKSNVYENYNQIDMTSTLAALMNLSIPVNNIGRVIHNLILGLPKDDQLRYLNYNAIDLLSKSTKIMNKELFTRFEIEYGTAKNYHMEFLKSYTNENLFEKAKAKYIEVTKNMSEYIRDYVNYFYTDYITVGIMMSTLSTINIILSGGSSFDFAYSLKDSKARVLLYFFLCVAFWLSQNFLIETESNFLWCTVPFNTFLILNAIWTIGKINFTKAFKINKFLNCYAAFVMVFSILSLMSSSFIEQEHFTWYYCISTLLLLMAFNEYKLVIKSIITENATFYTWSTVLLNNGKKWVPLLLAHIFMSRINARSRLTTFQNIADIIMYGEWKTLKFIYLFISLVLILVTIQQYDQKFSKVLTFITIAGLFCYRLLQEGIISQEITKFTFWHFLFYFALFTIIIYNFSHSSGSKPFTTCLTALIFLLCVSHRLQNLLLISGCIFTLNLGFKALTCIYKRSSVFKLLIAESLFSYAISKMFYFYQGNSNNLSSIDIDTGFLGFDSYPILVGVSVFIRTYSAQILCFVLLLHEGFNNYNKKDMYYSVYIISAYIVVRLNVYLFTMVILKNHLFIWSVFSPKFLYELSELFLFCLLFMLFFIYISFHQYLNLAKHTI